MSSLFKGMHAHLVKFFRVGSIESIEHPDHVGAFARELYFKS